MAQLKKDDYKEQGSSQLIPFDLRLFANRLLSPSCNIALQTWVIILLAVKLFLRHDEFHDINMSQFVAGMFEIKEHRVDVLVLEVKSLVKRTRRGLLSRYMPIMTIQSFAPCATF